MSPTNFIETEMAAAVARGVQQCVMIGSRPPVREAFKSSLHETFIPAQFTSDALATTLENSDFSNLKASLFIWIGGAGYRTVDAILAALAFIATLPQGSAVIFDYAVEHTSLGSLTHTALGALASRISWTDKVKYLIQPQAVAAMLRGLGFQQIVDLAQEELQGNGPHLVRAAV